jgi:hypothetical protein
MPQQSLSTAQGSAPPEQHVPSGGQAIVLPGTQQISLAGLQLLPGGRHIGVVVVVGVVVLVEVVLVEVVVEVVVVCAWHVPLAQLPLQHCSLRVQFFPLRLHPGGSADASPMPTDPSAPPTRAAPINLRALPRVREPSPVLWPDRRRSHLLWPSAVSSHNGGIREAQPCRPTKVSMRGYNPWRNFRENALSRRTSPNQNSTHLGE